MKKISEKQTLENPRNKFWNTCPRLLCLTHRTFTWWEIVFNICPWIHPAFTLPRLCKWLIDTINKIVTPLTIKNTSFQLAKRTTFPCMTNIIYHELQWIWMHSAKEKSDFPVRGWRWISPTIRPQHWNLFMVS